MRAIARRPIVVFLTRLDFLTQLLSRLVRTVGLRAGLRLTAHQLSARPRTMAVVPIGGPRLLARVGSGETDLRVLGQIWKDNCYGQVRLRDPLWIVDAGANVGYASVYFAERYPSAKIVAIEPDPGNLELLRKNTAAYENVVVFPGALTDSAAQVSLVDTGQGPWGFRVEPVTSDVTAASAKVEGVSIPDLMKRFSITQIDLLKMDIEGSERDVLGSCAEWIHRINVLIVELHEGFRPGCTRAYVNATASFEAEFQRGESTYAVREMSALCSAPSDVWHISPRVKQLRDG